MNTDIFRLFETRPVRDGISVELMNATRELRAVRYDICRATHLILNHIAYLRHAGFRAAPFFTNM